MKSDSRKPEGAYRVMQELSLVWTNCSEIEREARKADWRSLNLFWSETEATKVL